MSSLPRCVPRVGPACASQKPQLRKIPPETLCVHYTLIYVTELCAKIQPESQQLLEGFFFPECRKSSPFPSWKDVSSLHIQEYYGGIAEK